MKDNSVMESVLKNEVLSPHFVNNAFAMMRTLNRRNRIQELDMVLLHLSRIFHYIQKQNEIVELKEELLFVGHYLELQRCRFEDRFSYEIQSVDMEKLKVFKFSISNIIAEIIENIIEPSMFSGFVSIGLDGAVFIDYETSTMKQRSMVDVFI